MGYSAKSMHVGNVTNAVTFGKVFGLPLFFDVCVYQMVRNCGYFFIFESWTTPFSQTIIWKSLNRQ